MADVFTGGNRRYFCFDDDGTFSLLFENGADGASYGTHSLSSFTQGSNSGSHALYFKFISGIQNGNPDGSAFIVGGVVMQTISYGGTFVGTADLVSGRTFTDIGVRQTGTETAGQFALGLTESNAAPQSFYWTKFSNLPHSPGAITSGQTFTAPAIPQGISLDNLSVTFLTDPDQDGLTDLTILTMTTTKKLMSKSCCSAPIRSMPPRSSVRHSCSPLPASPPSPSRL